MFQEKEKPRKLLPEAVAAAGVDMAYYRKLKQGYDVPGRDGQIVPNAKLTEDGPAPLSYAFCSDTAYSEHIAEMVSGVHWLYHESTFLEEHVDLASATKHSTALQAAKIARKAGVELLILGHYSTRYPDIRHFQSEAETVFPNVALAEAGRSFST